MFYEKNVTLEELCMQDDFIHLAYKHYNTFYVR